MATIKKTKATTTHAQTDASAPKAATRGVRRTKITEAVADAAADEAAVKSTEEAPKATRRVRKSEATPIVAEVAPVEGVSKRKQGGTTANELAKKVQVAAEAKKAPKAAKGKPGSIVIVRRQKTAIDDVASTLLGMTTIEEMLEYAETVGDIAEKKTKNMTNLRRAAAGGTHTGLLRMRVGNLIRGAINRQAKMAAIEQTGKSARSKKK